jgi:hypothetical protein
VINNDFTSGRLVFLKIPARYRNCTYEVFYRQLVQQNKAIPLGLYRHVSREDKEDSQFWFVFVNPSGNTVLREHDRVYVITGKESRFKGWDVFDDDGMYT